MKTFLKIFILNLFLLFHSCGNNSTPGNPKQNKSISLLQDISGKELTYVEKREILDKAYQTLPPLQDDSLKNNLLLEISYQYLKLKDSIAFLRTNREARILSITLNDSSGIASTYWDLAHYYHGQNIEDSAYFYYSNAQKIFELKGNDLHSARLLLNMAIIQKNIKDYTGSEITTTNAIALLKPLNENKQLYVAYNNLGIVFNELEENDRALDYYETAMYYLSQTERPDLFPSLWNNMGIVYNNKKEYDKATEYYNKAVTYEENLENSDLETYAMLLDNRTYNQFKSGDTTGVFQQFSKALGIRERLNDVPGIIINKLHMAEFLLAKKDTTTAITYGSQAKELSQASQNTRDLLASLLILSNAEKDNALTYTNEYIKINDSLQKEERAIRNKFARIRFETDEYISETERLSQRVVRISFIAIGLILISVLLYIIKDQWSRNKFIKQKQDANQEIYNLILTQQKNFEEGREKEKRHISRELHDGILGKLLGVRLSLDSLNEEDTPDIKKKRFEYIEEIQTIAEEIRLISHRLNKVSLVDVDFNTVLEELLEKQNRGKIKFRLDVNPSINWESIEDDIKINFYRIIQEAINNIHKHSEATEALVQIQKIENQLILRISDNGNGIEQMHTNRGIGLKNMEARAKNLNGKLKITSGNSNAKGTFIKLAVEV